MVLNLKLSGHSAMVLFIDRSSVYRLLKRVVDKIKGLDVHETKGVQL